jgi:hypothetical protein
MMLFLSALDLSSLIDLTDEVGHGQVDHLIAAAVEHRFECPKIKTDGLVEFDCRGHGEFGSVDHGVYERRTFVLEGGGDGLL